MIQIENVLHLYKWEKKFLARLKKMHGGSFHSKSWDDGKENTRKIKNRLSEFLLSEQAYKCVYCQRLLIAVSKQIDHIAAKRVHPEYTLEPLNLAYSCTYCNEPGRKGERETVLTKRRFYSENIFLILHPYLDDVSQHLIHQDSDGIFINYTACSAKGKFTCNVFGLHLEEMTILRSREFKLAQELPVPNLTLKGLIKKAVAYKKS